MLNFTDLENKQPNYSAKYLELCVYDHVFKLQEKLAQDVRGQNKIVLLGCEHNDVITLGRRASSTDVFNNEILPIVSSTRGGLATIHSRGQLVVYPILDLRAQGLSVKQYVELLLDTAQEFLCSYGVACDKDMKQVGLYTKTGKIAFCGIEVRNRVTLHGISLNISNDLNLFKLISPCGLENKNMDRLQNHTDQELDLSFLFSHWSSLFKEKLNI